MVREQIEIIRPLVQGWEQGDFTPKDGVTTDDLVMTGFTPDGVERAQGAKEIAAYLRSRIFSEFSRYWIDVADITSIDDSHLLLSGNQYAVGKASGVEMAETVFIVFALRDGKVSEVHWHQRREGALESAGLDGAPG